MHGLSQVLGINMAAPTPDDLKMDGQTESVNQDIKQFLWLFVNQQQDDWYEWVLISKFAYND